MFFSKKLGSSLAVALLGVCLFSDAFASKPVVPVPPPNPALDRTVTDKPTDLDVLDYRNDVRDAANFVTKWFWSELGVAPPAEVEAMLSPEEKENFQLVVQRFDLDNQARLALETAANREVLIQKALSEPTTNPFNYEERMKTHARRFEYYMGVYEQGPGLTDKYPVDPTRPELGQNIGSQAEAYILAVREIQQAYVEMVKYSGWHPKLEKIASYFHRFSNGTKKIIPKELGALGGASYLGYTSITAEEAEFASQLSVFSANAVVGGVAGYTCAILLSGIPKGLVGWWIMPTLNNRLAPRYAKSTFQKAFSSHRAKPFMKRLAEFGKKNKK